ncbi:MAG: beta-1,6-N-acetylglucosaminyltransferase [Salinivirgaceae bacterium]
MKTAFIILAHKEPRQLGKLIRLIKTEKSGVFVHIDKKSNLASFKKAFLKEGVNPDFLIQKINIVYSSYRYIDATLLLLQEAFQREYNYFVLLGGQDYPLKPIGEILYFFEQNSNTNFIEYEAIPTDRLGLKGLNRTNNYSFIVNGKNETLFPWKGHARDLSVKGKILNFGLWVWNFGKTTRTFPYNLQPYYSSQWWNISREAVEHIFRFLVKHPKYIKYHKRALHPEEMFFQSIVLNNSILKQKTTNNNLRYIKWIDGKKHPEYIDVKDIKIIEQDFLFARKVKPVI